ncbi:hypothetical protein RRG08_065526 [Elysia crispata]|uniref:Uncharacterized protein n=1 Tax=Elysia crispata TaxID=231223 RepID=A0AAE1E0B6_9GAST|nr:hypothetical protein RRG08_065526 [Elysia crispata]
MMDWLFSLLAANASTYRAEIGNAARVLTGSDYSTQRLHLSGLARPVSADSNRDTVTIM